MAACFKMAACLFIGVTGVTRLAWAKDIGAGLFFVFFDFIVT
jgi:hypothetical protein